MRAGEMKKDAGRLAIIADGRPVSPGPITACMKVVSTTRRNLLSVKQITPLEATAKFAATVRA
jgi:hypothetical protein